MQEIQCVNFRSLDSESLGPRRSGTESWLWVGGVLKIEGPSWWGGVINEGSRVVSGAEW